MSDSQPINPYASPHHVSDGSPIRQSTGTTRFRFAISFAALLVGGSVAAAVAAAIDIESIVFSGPILSVVSLILVAIARQEELRQLIWLSAAILAMSIGCFATIYFLEWSPGDAQTPISIAIGVFATLFQSGWWLVYRVYNRDRLQLLVDYG